MMTEELYSLARKAAIVTGAGDGIGRAIAQTFAGAGARVACVDIDGQKAQATASSCGDRALAVPCDVTSEADTRAAVERAAASFGGLHVLVNGAATYDPTCTVVDCAPADWDRVFAVNVRGVFLMSKWAIPVIAKSGGGSVIHIASQMGSVGAAGRAVYCATKGALINLARAMAVDHAAERVRVNTLSPGATETTRMTKRFGTMEAARAAMGPKHPMGRLGQPSEIAAAALFLASGASSFMTGADLVVDGGYIAL
jgi:NAD(P)-dependent dehydrogenase (short-subunit alcohol dehydrogenase family)